MSFAKQYFYVYGKDLSGTLNGVGGLLAIHISSNNNRSDLQDFQDLQDLQTSADRSAVGGVWYFPLYDNNGNITDYVSETGDVVASYTYDAFGRTLSATGPMADTFPFRFSTKYYDAEAGLYYYGYRYYSPELGRWLTRDPIEEDGGDNLYAFCGNNGVSRYDVLGREPQNPAKQTQVKIPSEKVPIEFDAWCIRKRNRPFLDVLANILSTGYWGGHENIQLNTSPDVKESDAPCAGGVLIFRMFPHIGYPPRIGEPKRVPKSIEEPLGNKFVGGASNYPFDNTTQYPSAILFGEPELSGYDSTIMFPNGFPRYDYTNALFNIGRSLRIRDVNGNETHIEQQEQLWRSWNTMWHQPNFSDGSMSVLVGCGDYVEVKMGNVGYYEFQHNYRVTGYRSSGWRGSN